MRRLLLGVGLLGLVGAGLAQERTADDLLAGMERADMTYRQLMEIMGSASAQMQEGIVRQNQQMVLAATEQILNHPAPSHEPWAIMPEAEQEAFKQTLVAFDQVLDNNARRVAEEAEAGDWLRASRALQTLNASCIACHSRWKDRAGAR